jgi:2-hydroxy fatty acid dioxygenase
MTTQTLQTKTENAADCAAHGTMPKANGRPDVVGTIQPPPLGLLVAHVLCAAISGIIVLAFWEFEDASSALAFYGVYHRYGWNQVIHFFGVPGILWTLFIFMVHIPVPVMSGLLMRVVGPLVQPNNTSEKKKKGQTTTPASSSPPPLNYALCMAIAYGLFYLQIDPIGGTLFAPVLYGMYASAVSMRKRDQEAAAAAAAGAQGGHPPSATVAGAPWYGTGNLLKLAAVVHFLCWYVQIHLGHKVIEGAQPAVLQSLGGALTVAPLFAFYEGLWLVGINQGLKESTRVLVDKYTIELCTSGQVVMKACETLAL